MTGQVPRQLASSQRVANRTNLPVRAAEVKLAAQRGSGVQDGRVRAVYLTMELMGWFVLVPLSFASLVTGLVQSLGTRWVRHYWVLVKLGMNIFATTILLLYLQTLSYLADVAAETRVSGDLAGLRTPSTVVHAAGALVLLLVAVTLSVYTPRGMTRYGQRKQLSSVHCRRHDVRWASPRPCGHPARPQGVTSNCPIMALSSCSRLWQWNM